MTATTLPSLREQAEYAHRCELRAVHYGHHAFVLEDGAIKVVSHSRPGQSWRVRFSSMAIPGVPIVFSCECEAGVYRHRFPIPCWHAALAARRLEREGLAAWRDGLFYDVRPQPDTLTEEDDPFNGLAPRERTRREHWGAQV